VFSLWILWSHAVHFNTQFVLVFLRWR
jgi:hypothetical protein